jgi:hypothetical protein
MDERNASEGQEKVQSQQHAKSSAARSSGNGKFEK